jgi:hypothetical protein
VAGACKGEKGPTDVNPGISGVYILETVNGMAMPIVEAGADEDGPFEISFDSSTITLSTGSAYVERIALRFIQPGFNASAKGDIHGTYSLNGTALRFFSATLVVNGQPANDFVPDTINATIASNVITSTVLGVRDDGSTFPIVSVYRRK